MSDKKPEEKATKIIVAEDSSVNRRILVHLLSRMGFEVSEHPDGQKAWDEFKGAASGTYSAIFSDIMMPELDGLSFLKSVREEGPDKEIPFVLLTAMSDKDQIIQARNLKVNGYLLKPVEYEKVKKKMEELFPGRRFPAQAS
jgi:two-component system chemotaxis response regulator CheY